LLLVVSVIWCGMMSAGREIVKERSIYLHERFANLSPAAYVASKVPPLTLLCFLQTVLLCSITFSAIDLGGNYFLQILILFLTATAAMFLGLLISSSLRRQDQVVSLYPVVLVAQIVFSGVIVSLSGITDIFARLFVLTRWSHEAMMTTLPSDRLDIGNPGSVGMSVAAIVGFMILYGGLAHAVLVFQDRRASR